MFRRVMKFLKIFVLVCLVLAFITGYNYQKDKINKEKQKNKSELVETNNSKSIKKNVKVEEKDKQESKEEKKEEKDQEETKTITNETKTNNVNKNNNVQVSNNTNNKNETKIESEKTNNDVKTESVVQQTQETKTSTETNTTSNTSSALDEAFSKHSCTYDIYKENGVEKEYSSFSECTSDYGKVLDSSDSVMCYTSGYDQNGNEKFKMQICYK